MPHIVSHATARGVFHPIKQRVADKLHELWRRAEDAMVLFLFVIIIPKAERCYGSYFLQFNCCLSVVL